ncbi:serine hydrolase domain-containing protein [Bradyrhizobium sp. SZCCHNS2015]|uniref:serine hydrolase domain-containing protein n=1 Tax=Bradyrhizobium sp. SZCCHNS2015 TaxID=3057305 RepID=UPI0028E7B86A|nr:serine hydrolase domain-containing protein [Bradyrhizobium sp. SZCCHNS2015]
MRSSFHGRSAALFLVISFVTSMSANAGLLPERVKETARERITGTYQTLAFGQTIIFGVVDGDRSEIVAFGKLDDGRTPDGDTVYEIGSITKTFTATLLAQEVLSGQVTLETPVAQLLRGFEIPARSGKEITLDELATQRSGLPRIPPDLHPCTDYDPAKLRSFLATYELPRDPDAAYEYSNLGFGLLGYALSRREATRFGALVYERIFKPLNMTMSATEFTEAMRAHVASGRDERGMPAQNCELGALAGSGSIRSTVNDMLRYLKANMGIDPSPLADAMKLAQRPRNDIPKTAMRIGLAWMTTSKGLVWHGGATLGYRSFLGFTADGRRGVVVLTNSTAEVDDLGFATLDTAAWLAPTYNATMSPRASIMLQPVH